MARDIQIPNCKNVNGSPTIPPPQIVDMIVNTAPNIPKACSSGCRFTSCLISSYSLAELTESDLYDAYPGAMRNLFDLFY